MQANLSEEEEKKKKHVLSLDVVDTCYTVQLLNALIIHATPTLLLGEKTYP